MLDNQPNPSVGDPQQPGNWSPFQEWAQRLAGRLMSSSDDGLLGTILAELVEVSGAEETAIWQPDTTGVPVRRMRRPDEKIRPALEGEIGVLIRTERPDSRVIRCVSAGPRSMPREVLIEPLLQGEPIGWMVAVLPEGSTWHEAELSTMGFVAGEIQRFRTAQEGGERDKLQDLVADVAGTLMSETTASYKPAMTALVERLGSFFDVDVAYLRRHDHERRVTVMVAEWPERVDVPDPDPLAEVSFTADPMWAVGEHLKEPFIFRPEAAPAKFEDRVQQASGLTAVTSASVPLLQGTVTVGIIGCVKFGDRAWSHEEISALRAIAALIVQFQARIDAEVSAEYQGSHDTLTGLLRRKPLLESIDERLSNANAFAVVVVELDRFEVISESLGAEVSDAIVVTVADRLSQTLRSDDRIARVGPARFAMVFDADVSLQPSAVAARLLDFVRQPFEVAGHEIVRTASAGIVLVEEPDELPEADMPTAMDLLQQASDALGDAKRRGGNRYEIFEPGGSTAKAANADRLTEEALLRRALSRHELAVHYQPEINLIDGSVLGAEALIRWHHPVKGLLTAGAFIDLAEESGLVIELGWWVLDEACRQAAQWVADGVVHRPFEIRVNLAAAQLASDEVVDRVREALETHGLPPESVCLEITETSVMADFEVSKGVLGRLRELGVRLAVDDFGTGFSSMSYIRDLPVQIVKIDQTFVKGLGTRPADAVIVDSMIQLGIALGLDVVAEGLEELVHWQQLLSMGCSRAQGFYLARPASATDIEATLRSGIPELVPEVTV